jgi:TPR repeat protein
VKKFRPIVIFILVICLSIAYVLKDEILLTGVSIYALSGSGTAQQLIGEYYADKSRTYNKKANEYFTNSLMIYKSKYTKLDPRKQGAVAHIIGSNYECGKGVESNKDEAKKWYEESNRKGFVEAVKSLKRLD